MRSESRRLPRRCPWESQPRSNRAHPTSSLSSKASASAQAGCLAAVPVVAVAARASASAQAGCLVAVPAVAVVVVAMVATALQDSQGAALAAAATI